MISRQQLLAERAKRILNNYSIDQKARLRTFNQNVNLLNQNNVNLRDDVMQLIHEKYIEVWLRNHPEYKHNKFDKLLADRAVINGRMTKSAFIEMVNDLPRDRPIEDAYNYYNQQLQLISQTNPIQINNDYSLDKVYVAGFKDKNKYKFYDRELKQIPSQITNYFPSISENLKRYGLHKIAPKGTYIIDEMSYNEFTYLVAINVNTRYLIIELINDVIKGGIKKANVKSTQLYLRCLIKIIKKVKDTNPIKYIISDSDRAFSSNLAKEFYKNNNIIFRQVPRMLVIDEELLNKVVKTDPLHSSLSILDRVIRTIRDMCYNANLKMTPNVINEMVNQYNHAPHKTLTNIFGFPVSPLMVQRDKNMEEYIVMKLNKENILTKLDNGYDIPIGTHVKIYNGKRNLGKRRIFVIEGVIKKKLNGLYLVSTEYGDVKVPRYMISPLIAVI